MSGLSLNQWFALMGFNPWHAFQLADTQLIPVTSSCNVLLFDRASANADRVGRRDIARSIAAAEGLIKRHAGYWPSPRFVEVTLPYPQLADRRLHRLWDVDPQGRWVSITLPDAHVQAAGPAVETGSITAALSYSDEDGDGLFETATAAGITVPSGTTAAEVVARFVAADCGPVTPRPEITPRSVSVSGTSATLVFDAWTLVRPVRTSGFVQAALNPTIVPPAATSPFAASVEVLRRRADPTGTTLATAMAVLTWETRPAPDWLPCCDATSTDPAATRQAIARVTIRDGRAGVVALGEAVYDATSGTWSAACDWRCSPPDRVTLRYQAGVPLVDGLMDPAWQTVVARLAAAELARPVCACEGANKELYEWQVDRARTGATNELFQAPPPNPLGTRRGHVYAWDQIVREQRLTGVYAG